MKITEVRVKKPSRPFKYETVLYEDSLVFRDALAKSYYKLNLDVPVDGSRDLVNSIKYWMNVELGGTYTDSLTFDTLMLDHYAKAYLKRDGGTPGIWDSIAIKMVCDAEKYVSYEFFCYDYMGGDHGLPFTFGATFVKPSGLLLGWEMIAHADGLGRKLKEQIFEQYFCGVDSLFDTCVFRELTERDEFPLPEAAPFIVNDSVCFIYQPFEVAEFFAGQPRCALSRTQLQKFLSSKIKLFLLSAK